jgi:hypothetical protein
MKLEQISVDGDTAPVPQLADPQDRRPILSTRRVSGWTLAVRKIGSLNLRFSQVIFFDRRACSPISASERTYCSRGRKWGKISWMTNVQIPAE